MSAIAKDPLQEARKKQQTMINTDLTLFPLACFKARPDEMTIASIDHICEQAHYHLHANPSYLFMSEQDAEILKKDALKHCHIRLAKGESTPQLLRITHLINQTTGNPMYIVTLPDAEPGTLLFGLFTY